MSYNVLRVSEVLSGSEGFGRSIAKPDNRLLSEGVSPEAKRRVAGDEYIL